MRTQRLALIVLALGVAGCATIDRLGWPAPAAPPVRAAEVVLPPPATASAPPRPPEPSPAAPPAPQPELPPPPPAPPAPALAKPAPLSAPPAPSAPAAPAPAPSAAIAPSAPPPRVLGQQVNSEDERRIQGDAQRRIERTERLMKQIDERRLVGEQQENLLTVQSFLVKAREALSERDVQRALTLADKAFLLAEELVKVVR